MMSQTFAAGYIRTGVKEFLRMFDNHIKEIEDPDFQIQFVALGGYSVLELVLEEHQHVRSLVAGLSRGEVLIEEVYQRILRLLHRVEKEVEKSYDGSIVVYMYCLSQFDLALSYEVSVRIRDTRGLFWSRRMARDLVKQYWDKQISESLTYSSNYDHQPVPFENAAIASWLGSDFSTSVYHSDDTSRQYIQYPHSIEFAPTAQVAI